MSLKSRLVDDMKQAMRAHEKARLGTIRLINAAIKQYEVDNGSTADDGVVLTILEKMLKQRRDSIAQYTAAGRTDLADKEKAEMVVIQTYLPEPLTDAELDTLIDTIIASTGASSMRDMGKVMAQLKQEAAGRADMGALSTKVKARLG